MMMTTKIIHEYTYVDRNYRKCVFHIVRYDRNAEKRNTAECWITGWNPMPIHGKFYSSFEVFDKWMENNGWCRTIGDTVIVEKTEL